MQTIEFLPPRYKRRHQSRQWVLRRIAVLGTAAAIVVTLSAWQHRQQRSVEQQWLEAKARYAVAKSTDERLAQLRNDLAEARAAAELCVFLQRPWPRSLVLATINEALPPDVELAEMRIAHEAIPAEGASRDRGARGARGAKAPEKSGPPALADLRRLREEFDVLQTVVEIRGVAYESAALHGFVARLTKEPLVARAELGSQESVEDPRFGSVTQFSARIVVQPEYGHPLGPRGPLVAAQPQRPLP